MKHLPRRDLRGHFATPVRSDGWHDSDLAGQESARELVALGATSVYVNTFGVAYGDIDGVRVLLSTATPARYRSECALVTRALGSMHTGGFLRVARNAEAVAA